MLDENRLPCNTLGPVGASEDLLNCPAKFAGIEVPVPFAGIPTRGDLHLHIAVGRVVDRDCDALKDIVNDDLVVSIDDARIQSGNEPRTRLQTPPRSRHPRFAVPGYPCAITSQLLHG